MGNKSSLKDGRPAGNEPGFDSPGESGIEFEKILKIALPDHVNILILPPQSRPDNGNVDFDEEPLRQINSRKALRDIIQIRARKYYMPKSLSDNSISKEFVDDTLQVFWREEQLTETKSAIEIGTRGEVSSRFASETLQLSLTIQATRPLEIRRAAPHEHNEFDSNGWKKLT
eukprot:TRINITY_DN4700_c0_g2_i1.p1 TRINITY_DN4700_c0_g2~~TRINITY_DN4700_c0_g2_i1.p1  ORF type:complete len:172 (+),score=25.51 TRINITY_DN4700_c0_g2_i1:17-532(+)